MLLSNYINGQLVPPTSGQYIHNISPIDGKIYSQIPDSDENDVQTAVQAAQAAFGTWSKTSPDERHRILEKIASLIEQQLDTLAEAETIDSGKPITTSRTVDIPRACANFRFFATAAMQFASESHHTQGVVNYTLRRPIGVVGCISPWNLPLYLFSWKIAPALAAGNCVVAKPSEITPMTAFLLSRICIEAGLPAGVLNIVHGYGHKAGQAIVAHPLIKAISFTGGTATGRRIAATAAPMFKKLSLELGGKNPNIIFADANLDEAVSTTVRSSFANQGQICLCGSRILIERSIYNQFKTLFLERVAQLRTGHPLLPSTQFGAVVSAQHKQKILDYIQVAREEGGTILCGGNELGVDADLAGGYYIQPTVIEGLPQNSRCNMEEIFGPVVTLQPFDSEEDMLEIANGVEYGLSATVWTTHIERALRIADSLDTGIVWVNTWLLRDLRTPFGGVKNSGVGREGGWEAMRFFTEPRNVCIKYI